MCDLRWRKESGRKQILKEFYGKHSGVGWYCRVLKRCNLGHQNLHMKNTICLFISLFISVSLSIDLSAQDFLITAKGDTLRGKIKILGNQTDARIQFVNAQKERKNFTMFQVKEVFIKNEKFIPVKNGQRYVYMKALREGYLGLYAFQLENQITYDGRFFLKKDGQGLEVPNLTFKKTVSRFLSECAEVEAEMENGNLGKSDLIKIVDRFNACIEAKTLVLNATKAPNVVLTANVLESWTQLADAIQKTTIVEKESASEMITDIKGKLARGEKIPKFLADGLRNLFKGHTELLENLETALKNSEQ